MTHPTPGELLALHFGEAEPARAQRLAAHAAACPACARLLEDAAWAERLLSASAHDEQPPADGLARVLAEIDRLHPAPARGPRAWRAVLPSAAALVAGAAAVAFGGATAALVFFTAGSVVTLSLAPMLIDDTQRQGRAEAR